MNRKVNKIVCILIIILFLCTLPTGYISVKVHADENDKLSIAFDENNFITKDVDEDISGTFKSSQPIKSITYNVNNEKMELEGQAFVDNSNNTWKVDNLKLVDGKNEVTVFIEDSSGHIEEESTTITYDMGYIKESTKSNLIVGENGEKYIDNIILVYFKENTDENKVNEIVSSINGKIVGVINTVNMYQVQIKKSTEEEINNILEKLGENEEVIIASIDKVLDSDEYSVNDPWGGNEVWSEENVGGKNWGLEAIQAMSAWKYNKYLSTINIGVVDDGFDITHEDLKVNFPNSTSESYNIKQSHGTHVVGTIGAIPNNGKGVTGIVWNSNILLGPSILGADKPVLTYSRIFYNLTSVVESGAKVINCSFGESKVFKASEYSSKPLPISGYMAANWMTGMLKKGYDFLIVQSAGNGSNEGYAIDAKYNGVFASIDRNNFPRLSGISYDEVDKRIIIVGAAQKVNNSYVQAVWSNGGDNVDICAPGYQIYSCSTNNSYKLMSGTSMAAPHVTAVAALTWSANPELTAKEVRSIVLDKSNTIYDVYDNTTYSYVNNDYRMVNANLCVKAALKTRGIDVDNPVESPLLIKSFSTDIMTPQVENTRINLVAEAEGKGNIEYRFVALKDGKATFIKPYSKNNKVNWTPREEGSYSLYVKVKDESGKEVEEKINYEITKNENIEFVSFDVSLASPQNINTPITLTTNAKSEDKLQYKYVILNDKKEAVYSKGYSNKNSITWTPKEEGTYYLLVKVKNNNGDIIYKKKTFEILSGEVNKGL